MATDPVCGMRVDKKSAAGTAIHAGAAYYQFGTIEVPEAVGSPMQVGIPKQEARGWS